MVLKVWPRFRTDMRGGPDTRVEIMITSGEDFPRIETAIDCCGNERRFIVEVHTTEGGFFLRATEENRDGYEFAAHSETSPYLALGRLRSRIREGIATRYLSVDGHSRGLGHDIAVGRIGYGCVVIDGEEVTFEEFAEMLQVYEGSQFLLKIADPYEKL
jgi:hypothetical protein